MPGGFGGSAEMAKERANHLAVWIAFAVVMCTVNWFVSNTRHHARMILDDEKAEHRATQTRQAMPLLRR